jgi:hypothetical protein
MFKITEETKTAAVEEMRKILGDGPTDAQLDEAFEAAVAIVKKQFGM